MRVTSPSSLTSCAVIDIGTNSVRLFIAEIRDAKVRPIVRTTTITRLGEGLALTGAIGEAPARRTIKVLKRYKREIDEAKPAEMQIIATEAVRKASNGAEFASKVAHLFGTAPKVVSGKREAELMAFGALYGYNHINRKHREAHRTSVVVDIGGGSTEFSVIREASSPLTGRSPDSSLVSPSGVILKGAQSVPLNGPPRFNEFRKKLTFCRSFGVGSTVVTDLFGLSKPVDVQRLDGARKYLDKKFAPVGKALRGLQDRGMFAVAGTATSLAAMLQELEPYNSKKVHGYEVTAKDVAYLTGMFADLSLRDRRRVIALEKERAPIILGGILIVEAAMRAVDVKSFYVSELDLLDALINLPV